MWSSIVIDDGDTARVPGWRRCFTVGIHLHMHYFGVFYGVLLTRLVHTSQRDGCRLLCGCAWCLAMEVLHVHCVAAAFVFGTLL